jgi:DNA invertase Pin-like site-specific DNA recombinase
MSEKIRSQHLARKAILYVRQSSTYQVLHNQESQEAAIRDAGSPAAVGLA